MAPYALHVTCAAGMSEILAGELRALNLPVVSVDPQAVETRGDSLDIFRLNLHLRTGHRVLWRVGEASDCHDATAVYGAASRIPWEDLLREDMSFRVRAAVEDPLHSDSRFAALKIKDAVADRMRRTLGRRPDSGHNPRSAALFLHWKADGHARIFIDTSGVPLSYRNYRREGMDAPLRESLAAGILRWSEWDAASTLVNPMCGSGTMAIEAAGLAARRAPGLGREFFAFMRLRNFDRGGWERIRAEAVESCLQEPTCVLLATDADPAAIAAARANAARAGLASWIRFEVSDYAATPVPEGPRCIVINPPYGQRMGGDDAEIESLYRSIGAWLKRTGGPGSAVVISGHLRMARRIGLKAGRIHTVFNGPIECRLLEFPLYAPPSSPGG